MKPAPFSYHDPCSVDEALELLSEHGDDAKVLAGGQSLVPLLNFRLACPERIIDINRVDELAYLSRGTDTLRIGALTRHAGLERSAVVASGWPLLSEAAQWIGHPQIRNRGTVGGSVAHADPAAELPVVLAALDARFKARSVRGERSIGWRDFFVTYMTTTLAPDELLVEIEVPATPQRTGSAFTEYAARHGDFALGGAAVLVSLDPSGACRKATIVLLGAASTPIRAERAEALLGGALVDEEVAAAAGATVAEDISPAGDIHGSKEYRTSLIGTLVQRAITIATERARGADSG